MHIDIHPDIDTAARGAALAVAAAIRDSIEARGRSIIALSGGKTPWLMLQMLAEDSLPWPRIHVVQVDERAVPDDSPDRNFLHIRQALASIPDANFHPMPVSTADLDVAASRYADILESLAGTPSRLDLVHLGLGADGHTASLVPGDPVLDVADRDVAATNAYLGTRRMTLTYPAINRARRVLWLVTGAEKAPIVSRLAANDPTIPAGRISPECAILVADRAAASTLEATP
jgi:6-phosphogluconolactonase